MMRIVRQNGSVRVAALASLLGVTSMTVRRDLGVLAEAGLVDRVHGGATLPRPVDSRKAPAVSSSRAVRLVIGMLVPEKLPQHRALIRGAQLAARAMSAELRIAVSHYDSERDREEVGRLVDGKVDGLLLTPSTALLPDSDQLEWVRGLDIPAVIVERQLDVASRLDVADSVSTDHAHGILLAVRHLVELGHQRIGLFASDTPTTPWLERALHLARSLHQLPTDVPLKLDHPQLSRASADDYLDAVTEEGVTAVIAHPDPEAALLLRRATARGLTVPDDLAMIAYDDILAELTDVPLTAIAPPWCEVGRAAAIRLAKRLREGSTVVQHTKLSPTLCVRSSTVPADRPPTAS
ncbi:substrate-binding domain-containing protein [Microlunatus sp. GCM10028923]|uniref:substrate-binding domain-containing protein n=1 Tax=Microlunatus sp. GCM10028923 TaxID=3273400 RepID=UPI00360D7D1A